MIKNNYKIFLILIIGTILIISLYFEFLNYLNDISEIESETFLNNKSEQYLKIKLVNQFNSYIKICKQGKLKDKENISLSKYPKISVIMPIYNGGKYLYYSLRSIQNQKLKEIEIILIDDFSKDNSLNIIKNYMEEDPRIRIIKNNKNRKILYSKSIGALNSKGKFIIELDQDDMFIRNDCFDILINEAETNNLDLVHIRDFSKSTFYFNYKTKVNLIKDHLVYPQKTNYKIQPILKDKMFRDNNIYLLWGLLIKTKLYKEVIYHIWPIIMNYQIIFHEDYTISFLLVLLTKRYKYINKFAILHLIHQNSISNNYIKNKEYYLSILFLANIMNEYYIKKNPRDIYILINYIKLFFECFQYGKQIYPNLFFHIIKIILNNEYISTEAKQNLMNEMGINFEEYKANLINKSLIDSVEIRTNFKNDNFKNIFYKQLIEISIIIYCNEFKYIMETIKSLLNQIFINIEIIIVYDSSEQDNLNLIKNTIKQNKIIKIIDNKKNKGLIYSFAIGVLSSKGIYILTLRPTYILPKKNILNILYHKSKSNDLDILEFNLLIHKNEEYNNNYIFNLYKCSHLKSDIKLDFIKANKLNLELDQEKEILFNKLIKTNLFKEIIIKNKFIYHKDAIYNYYDNIFLFSFFKKRIKFNHSNLIGVIKNINNKELYLAKIMDNQKQKEIDSIFYINFLLDNTNNVYEEKRYILNEFYSIFNLIYSKINNNIISDDSIKLLKKFRNSKFINISDKKKLNFYYNSFKNY